MSYSDSVLPEFDQEMANTRKVLERVPDDKLEWQAHPKSHTIGWNANHLANIPDWLVHALATPELDIAPPGGEAYIPPQATNRQEILETFDRNIAAAREGITRADEEHMAQPWTLLYAGKPVFTLTRSAVLRQIIINHMIHHRAILCVYLRLNDIPVPGMYGPSGDE
ncbi:DinB family protein [Planctomyces sp. SH-PL62]|uniref:DinB family protein n=1 Tax=Planctomyces sp. SH-PL62 TaxID=1636152 RepID=UPI00078EA195|nr:DinB family protein [Planctomyces sp. SH-PL62]AMV40181.1 DinB superfamily protein [Planctomyces sp. SH-PL62]